MITRSELEQMGCTGPGYELPETLKAVMDINIALREVLDSFDAIQPAIKKAAEITSDEIASSGSPFSVVKDQRERRLAEVYRQFEITALPKFLQVRGEASNKAMLACDMEIKHLESEVESRIKYLADGLKKISGESAHDLASLLYRAGGGFPEIEGKLLRCHTARSVWHAMTKRSCGMLKTAQVRATELQAQPIDIPRGEAIEKLSHQLELTEVK